MAQIRMPGFRQPPKGEGEAQFPRQLRQVNAAARLNDFLNGVESLLRGTLRRSAFAQESASVRPDMPAQPLVGEKAVHRLDFKRLAYQGVPGAFAHIACISAFPDAQAVAFRNLYETVEAVLTGQADAVVLPCENILAGRVPDIHLLLPESGLSIVGEIFQRIELHLAAPEGTKLEDIKRVYSHPVALRQVRHFIARYGATPVEQSNTAIAAAGVSDRCNGQEGAVASELAAKENGLEIVLRNIEDRRFNATRFYVLAAKPYVPDRKERNIITSLLFEVCNKPGALLDAIGGFSREGINLTKLESYFVGGQFVATRFFCEFEGHPEQAKPSRALEKLKLHTKSHTILGVFPMSALGVRARAGMETTAIGETMGRFIGVEDIR